MRGAVAALKLKRGEEGLYVLAAGDKASCHEAAYAGIGPLAKEPCGLLLAIHQRSLTRTRGPCMQLIFGTGGMR